MFLVPVMLILVVMGIFLFSWAVKNGQLKARHTGFSTTTTKT